MKKADQRTRLTRLLLRRALTDLMVQKPIQSISITELCAAAGLNRGTFYAHYTDIYDLLGQMEEEMMETFRSALQPLLNTSADDFSPLKITTGIFQCIKDNADLCSVTLGPYGDKQFAARLLALGRESCLTGYSKYFEGATPQQIDYFYAFVSAGCLGLLEKWLGEGLTADAAEIARIAEGIMLHGIRFLHPET